MSGRCTNKRLHETAAAEICSEREARKWAFETSCKKRGMGDPLPLCNSRVAMHVLLGLSTLLVLRTTRLFSLKNLRHEVTSGVWRHHTCQVAARGSPQL